MEVFTPYTIDPEMTDELGHLNHVAAVKLFELARDQWYEKAGLWGGRPWSEEEILGTIVVNINVNYRQECFEGEKVRVKTLPLRMGTKSYTLAQELLKPDGSVAVDGHATSVVMDMDRHEVIAVPTAMAQHFPGDQ